MNIEPKPSDREVLAGLVERVTYHNAENGFCVLRANPYRLARDIRGIGFKTADAIAMKLGIEKTAMIRVRSGISYALTEGTDEGHCGLPTDELVPLAERLLEVPQQLIRTALDLELQGGTVIADRVGGTPCILLAGLA